LESIASGVLGSLLINVVSGLQKQKETLVYYRVIPYVCKNKSHLP